MGWIVFPMVGQNTEEPMMGEGSQWIPDLHMLILCTERRYARLKKELTVILLLFSA